MATSGTLEMICDEEEDEDDDDDKGQYVVYCVLTPEEVTVTMVTPVVTGTSVHFWPEQEVTVTTAVDCWLMTSVFVIGVPWTTVATYWSAAVMLMYTAEVTEAKTNARRTLEYIIRVLRTLSERGDAVC